MTKIKKVVASFIGIFLIGSATNPTHAATGRNRVESRIHNIIRALHAKKIQHEQSKRMFEYLEKHHQMNSIEPGKTPEPGQEEEKNTGNWDNWNNWSNWDTWNNWSNWDTWNNWSNWDTWNNWSNYQ